ncbi:hypothetical protein WN51_08664 [Melipona quadrifasciata]|uniref:Ig-like domain-containing protein n=1 Tax=Melipona quadrifasciata TaxID=166423 RepID=A0A0M9A7M8_9HYME|nr:hypothetical protein WN51_08664 [Melipona quadrifasciata]
MESIQGVAGQRATLPCNIQPREPNDAVSMVLWFKEDSGEPLYRINLAQRVLRVIDGNRNEIRSNWRSVYDVGASMWCGGKITRQSLLENSVLKKYCMKYT